MSLKTKIAGWIIGGLALLGFTTNTIHVGSLSDSTAHFSTIGNMGTSGAMLLTANVSAQVLATSSSREYARIANLNGSPIYCNANGDAAASPYAGIMIAASSSVALDQLFPYTGAIRCISPGQNASTSIYARQGN